MFQASDFKSQDPTLVSIEVSVLGTNAVVKVVVSNECGGKKTVQKGCSLLDVKSAVGEVLSIFTNEATSPSGSVTVHKPVTPPILGRK